MATMVCSLWLSSVEASLHDWSAAFSKSERYQKSGCPVGRFAWDSEGGAVNRFRIVFRFLSSEKMTPQLPKRFLPIVMKFRWQLILFSQIFLASLSYLAS